MVDAAEIAAARRRRVLRVQRKAVHVDETIWNIAMMLVRLDEAEPGAGLGGEARLVVEVEGGGDDGVAVVDARVVEPVVAALVALAADRPHELKDGVVEVELHADLRVGGLHVEGLVLGDEDLVHGGGEAIALLVVEVDVGGLEAGREVVGREAAAGGAVLDGDARRGDDYAALEALELDVNLDTVELKGGKGEGLARVLGEPEGEGHIQDAALARVADELGAGVALANHLGEAAAGLASELLPHEEEVVVEGIDGGATDNNAGAADEELTNVVGPVGPDALKLRAEVVRAVLHVVAALERAAGAVLGLEPVVLGLLEHRLLLALRGLGELVADVVDNRSLVVLQAGLARTVHVHGELLAGADAGAVLAADIAGSDAGEVDDDVHEVDQITVAVEGDLRLGAEGNSRVERLANRFHREISVLIITDLPEGKCRILREVPIKGALGNELGESTRTTRSGTPGGHLVCLT